MAPPPPSLLCPPLELWLGLGLRSGRTEQLQQLLSSSQLQCVWQFLNSHDPCWSLSRLQQEASSAELCLEQTGVIGSVLEPLGSQSTALRSQGQKIWGL